MLSVRRLDWNTEAERLIASLRLALAAGSLVVFWIDPTQPVRHWRVAYTGFVLYLVYSVVVFQIARPRPQPWLPIVSQIIDLLWILPVLYVTEGANTPFVSVLRRLYAQRGRPVGPVGGPGGHPV